MIRSGWKTKTLKHVAPLQRGFDLTKTSLRKGTVPVISSSGLWGYHDEAKVTGPGIVIGRYGTLGEVFFVHEDFWPHNTTLWVTDFCGNDPQFLHYLFRSLDISKHSGKTGVPGLNRNDLHTLKIAVPPLSEQQQIATILSTWDRAIELTEKLIAAEQKRKQAFMQQVLTGKVRLPGFTDAWVAVKMGDIFKRRSESGTSDLPTLSVTMDRGLIRRDSIDRKMETTLEAEQHLLVRKGDIAYNMMRMWQGASGLALEDGLVSPAYIVLKPTSKVDSLFASYFFKLRHTVKSFEFYSFGITGDRLRLYYKDFAAIPTKFPTLREQRRIAAILSTMDQEIEITKSKVGRLQIQKKGLMQQLLSGTVRVTTGSVK